MAGHIPDSLSVDWCTPDDIVERVHRVFGGPPGLDPCSNQYSKVGAARSFRLDQGQDGLIDPWDAETVYMNPPFGYAWYQLDVETARRKYIFAQQYKQLDATEKKRWTRTTITDWVKLASLKAPFTDSVGLIPAYPGTSTWQDYVWPTAKAVFFPRGRLSFKLPPPQKPGPAPMDCALVYWGDEYWEPFCAAFADAGKVIVLR